MVRARQRPACAIGAGLLDSRARRAASRRRASSASPPCTPTRRCCFGCWRAS